MDQVTPEYIPEDNQHVTHILAARLDDDELDQFRRTVLSQFDHGMWLKQSTESIAWMKECLRVLEIGNSEAARKLGIHHGNLGRWLRAETDPQLKDFQKFYIQFGIPAELDSPLKDAEILHFAGFARAVPWIAAWLGDSPAATDDVPPLAPDVFLYLYHFYATLEPLEHLVEDRPFKTRMFFQDTKRQIDRLIPTPLRTISTYDDFAAAIIHWGKAWLVCIRLIADEELGHEPYRVTSLRSVQVSNNDVHNHADRPRA